MNCLVTATYWLLGIFDTAWKLDEAPHERRKKRDKERERKLPKYNISNGEKVASLFHSIAIVYWDKGENPPKSSKYGRKELLSSLCKGTWIRPWRSSHKTYWDTPTGKEETRPHSKISLPATLPVAASSRNYGFRGTVDSQDPKGSRTGSDEKIIVRLIRSLYPQAIGIQKSPTLEEREREIGSQLLAYNMDM